jgi:hypothetical protein
VGFRVPAGDVEMHVTERHRGRSLQTVLFTPQFAGPASWRVGFKQRSIAGLLEMVIAGQCVLYFLFVHDNK